MSYHVFFDFSTGLAKPMICPKGTFDSIMSHVAQIENIMGIQRERYPDKPNAPECWKGFQSFGKDLKDEEFCREASKHNQWVLSVYDNFIEWFKSPPAEPVEMITPQQGDQFWCALHQISIPVERWDKDYYRERMEHLYEVMRGRTSEGVSFDEKPLTVKQAAQVINLFSEFLDLDDLRLDVPNGHDHLKSSSDGGYDWCEKCGAIDEYDIDDRVINCRKRKCPIKEQYGEE